jgi:hypothetical protein
MRPSPRPLSRPSPAPSNSSRALHPEHAAALAARAKLPPSRGGGTGRTAPSGNSKPSGNNSSNSAATGPTASFQAVAPAVELFSPAGKDPAARCAVRGSVTKVYERSVKGYAFALDGDSGVSSGATQGGGALAYSGGGSARLQLPRDAAKGLGLVQRFLALQLELPPGCGEGRGALSVELAVTDGKKARKERRTWVTWRSGDRKPFALRGVQFANAAC